MGEILYKYLDSDGGLNMLTYKNLQFTNPACLNDPFDCHPGLIDFSNVPSEKTKVWGKDVIEQVESSPYKNLSKYTWICSLSKVHNSILMWSYYRDHEGICIGIDKDKAKECLKRTAHCESMLGCEELEVQYKDVIQKPDYFHDYDVNWYNYLLSTKAKEWAHEQEVRLLLQDPVLGSMPMDISSEKNINEVDIRKVKFRPRISGKCFVSLYLGIKIDEGKKKEIIKAALKANPEIKIYQMTVDPDAFRLKEDEIIQSKLMENHNDKEKEVEEFGCGTPAFTQYNRDMENLRKSELSRWKYFCGWLKALRKLLGGL